MDGLYPCGVGYWLACIRVVPDTGLPVSGWRRILPCLYPGGVGYWLAFIRVVLDAGMPLSGWCVMLACLDPGGGGCWHAVILARRVMGSVFGWFVGAFEFCTCACAAGCVPRAHASACRVPLSPPRVPVFLGFRVQTFSLEIFLPRSTASRTSEPLAPAGTAARSSLRVDGVPA